MKAIVFEQYGSPDRMFMKDVAKPVPADNEVLVQVKATGLNPYDWHHLEADPFFIRLAGMGFWRPKEEIQILGADIAGIVEAVGKDVTEFQPGDAVFGEVGYGGLGEYVAAPAKTLVHKPDNLSFEEAASMPMVALTALQGMRDTGKIQAGQKVLINGASGGIGTVAVQLAKHYYNTEVTGVCSTRNLEMVKSIGADHVVDYTQQDFSKTGAQYDLIYCTQGNRNAYAYKRALAPGGICSIAGFTTLPHFMIQVGLLGAFITRTSDKTVTSMGTAQMHYDDLVLIRDLLADGTIKPVIDKCYTLSDTPDAMRYLETGHARGKVIVTVGA